MVIGYYLIVTVLTLLLSGIYLIKWNKHFDVYYSAIYMLIPFLNAGYYFIATARDVGEAITATKITYLGGCYLLLFIMMSIFSLCKLHIPRWLSFGFAALSTFVYCSALTIGHADIFYKEVSIETSNGITTINKSYGPLHGLFYPLIMLYFAISIATIIWGLKKRKEAPANSLILLLITEFVSVFVFFFGKNLGGNIQWIPAAYFFDGICYLFIIDRLSLYDIGSAVGETLVEHGENGFVSFDLNLNFLGANGTAKELLPRLSDMRVDRRLSDEKLSKIFTEWIDDFKRDELSREILYDMGASVLKIQVRYLYDGSRKRGYQLTLTDDTAHQQYLKTISDYNQNLRREIELKDKLLGAV